MKLKHQIGKDVEKKVQDQHRKYLLGEQVRYFLFYMYTEKGDVKNEHFS